jgi:predicted anti-sigma-YlaC factor YlaD
MDHIKTEVLVSLGTACEWETAAIIDHLAECRDCRARISRLGEVQGALAEADAVDPLALSRMVDAIVENRGAESLAPQTSWLTMVNPLLSAVACFLVVLLSAPLVTASTMGPGSAILMSLVVATSVFVWSRWETAAARTSFRGSRGS